MPKLTCLCGFIHNLSGIPDDGWVVIRDHDYEKVIAAEVALVAEGAEMAPARDEHMVTIVQNTVRIYECPICGAIAWFGGGNKEARFFTPVQER